MTIGRYVQKAIKEHKQLNKQNGVILDNVHYALAMGVSVSNMAALYKKDSMETKYLVGLGKFINKDLFSFFTDDSLLKQRNRQMRETIGQLQGYIEELESYNEELLSKVKESEL